MPRRYENNRVLFFSDTHAPYHHKDTVQFLTKIKEEFSPDRVICGGDIGDIYSISNYPREIDHKDSWHSEIKGLRSFVKNLSELFPKVDICDSNHDARIYRKAVIAGIPRESIIPYKEVIGAPEDWKWMTQVDITVDADRSNWTFIHSLGGSKALNVAQQRATNIVMGHHHSRFGAVAFNNSKKTLWGIDGGCLISDKGSPFKYNKGDIGRPVRGCCMIIEGEPHMIRMK